MLPLHADWGRVGEGASLGQPQCSAATYGGNNFVQGAAHTPCPSRSAFQVLRQCKAKGAQTLPSRVTAKRVSRLV